MQIVDSEKNLNYQQFKDTVYIVKKYVWKLTPEVIRKSKQEGSKASPTKYHKFTTFYNNLCIFIT